MRKEAKIRQNVETAYIQGYHANSGANWHDSESYAFAGFCELLYFNSDRKLKLKELPDGTMGFVVRDGEDPKPLQGYGLEIETECSSILYYDVLAEVMQKVIFPNFKFGKQMFKMQEDGSLGGETSVEVITQVMTKGRIRNDYAAYQTMFDKYFPRLGITANARSTSCGMHVNISNAVFGDTKAEQDEAIRKFYYAINRHYRFMCKLFCRPEDKTEWCAEMTQEHLESQYYFSDEHAAENYAWPNAMHIDLNGPVPTAHSNCVNLAHYKAGRIELRLVGGQDSYVRFRNTMECVFHLTENIRKVRWADLDDLTKLFKGCNNYVVKRLRECVGIGGFTAEMWNNLYLHAKHEDFELHGLYD
ncbi:MAG: hypothetical protein J6Y20_10145 [Lachnospiraceae bacterium]|nr:hypothetical protein [Lachnospiraceae bacterium]MBP5462474.1 hypothetical protein [Lachnospiraceae bacterium]